MRVLLYRVGRNLNRAYRTCEAFGVDALSLFECNAELSGNLYSATDRVHVEAISTWPDPSRALALETTYRTPLRSVDWRSVDVLILGGETCGLPTKAVAAAQRAHIPMRGIVSGLTVEAALAIALYARAEALQ